MAKMLAKGLIIYNVVRTFLVHCLAYVEANVMFAF